MSTGRRTPLDRKKVAEAALRLLDEVGLDGLSLRLIAGELGVKAPALYWHFKDKQALLDELATELYRRMTAVPEGPEGPGPATWQERLLCANRGLRAGLLRHRDGAKVFSGSRFTGTEHALEQERLLRHLTEAGFTLAQAARAFTTAFHYTLGFVAEEQGVQPRPDERRDGFDLEERARRLAEFPLAAGAGAELFTDFDAHFEEGLALVIAGIEARYGPGHGSGVR
jgi:AcrR family transcriptional regulator